MLPFSVLHREGSTPEQPAITHKHETASRAFLRVKHRGGRIQSLSLPLSPLSVQPLTKTQLRLRLRKISYSSGKRTPGYHAGTLGAVQTIKCCLFGPEHVFRVDGNGNAVSKYQRYCLSVCVVPTFGVASPLSCCCVRGHHAA